MVGTPWSLWRPKCCDARGRGGSGQYPKRTGHPRCTLRSAYSESRVNTIEYFRICEPTPCNGAEMTAGRKIVLFRRCVGNVIPVARDD